MDHTTSTLDDERTDQLRTFLTVEAAADAATARPRAAHPGRRRLIGGVAVASVLGAGLFAASAVAGGPGSGPASVNSASALAIEDGGDGWTTISIADINADPDAVVAELTAAGIEARTQAMDLDRSEDGAVPLESSDIDETVASKRGITVLSWGSSGLEGPPVGTEGLAGLSVSLPETVDAPLPEGTPPVDPDAAFEAAGVRTDVESGDIAIQDGSEATVVVLYAD